MNTSTDDYAVSCHHDVFSVVEGLSARTLAECVGYAPHQLLFAFRFRFSAHCLPLELLFSATNHAHKLIGYRIYEEAM